MTDIPNARSLDNRRYSRFVSPCGTIVLRKTDHDDHKEQNDAAAAATSLMTSRQHGRSRNPSCLVSVHSQADTEWAALKEERPELKADDEGEHRELAAIYVARGLDPSLAKQLAEQLMAHDAMGLHVRDELGISETFRPPPIQAALASASSFAVGAALPLLVTTIAPQAGLIPLVFGTSIVFLALLRVLAALAGGAGMIVAAVLGYTGHAGDRRRRGVVWNGCVSVTTAGGSDYRRLNR